MKIPEERTGFHACFARLLILISIFQFGKGIVAGHLNLLRTEQPAGARLECSESALWLGAATAREDSEWVASGVVVHCGAAQMQMHTDSTHRAKSKDEGVLEAWDRRQGQQKRASYLVLLLDRMNQSLRGLSVSVCGCGESWPHTK